jgi:hypothetical protein
MSVRVWLALFLFASTAAGCAVDPRPRRGTYGLSSRERRAAFARSHDAGPRSTRDAAPRPTRQGRQPPPQLRPPVATAIDVASNLVGKRAIIVKGVDYGKSCGALVRAALDRAGRPLPDGIWDAGSIHALASSRNALRSGIRPSPGDVVFLADRPGGAPVHVGLVSRVEPDGTAVALHRVARGVMRLRFNLAYPSKAKDPQTGKMINDMLLVGREAKAAGSLVVGLASLL